MGLKTYASMTEPAEVDGGDGAHSGVGEASPHGDTFPALVHTHRTLILTIPAL
jgi:hypothetical protein